MKKNNLFKIAYRSFGKAVLSLLLVTLLGLVIIMLIEYPNGYSYWGFKGGAFSLNEHNTGFSIHAASGRLLLAAAFLIFMIKEFMGKNAKVSE